MHGRRLPFQRRDLEEAHGRMTDALHRRLHAGRQRSLLCGKENRHTRCRFREAEYIENAKIVPMMMNTMACDTPSAAYIAM
jgi:hypothetical protein